MATALSLPSLRPGKLLEKLDGFVRGSTPSLDAPFQAQHSTVTTTHGTLSLYSDRSASGHPLLLIHSVNAAASSYEMKPLFEAYVGRRAVHALDLPGFGTSGRDEQPYDAARFSGAIGDVLRHIAVEGHPADIVALSLGCEFAARAAIEAPELVRSLVFISPTGLGASSHFSLLSKLGPERLAKKAHEMLDKPILGDALYRLLVSQPVLRHHLAKSFQGPVDQGLLQYGYAAAHQPGAKHAPLWFLSGSLFTPDAFEELYAKVQQPVLALYDQDAHTSFERVAELQGRSPNWQASRIANTRGLPHFERPDETRNRMDIFFQTLPLTPWSLPWHGVHFLCLSAEPSRWPASRSPLLTASA